MNNLDNIRSVAKSWNHLETKFIENKLTSDFVYHSKWMKEDLIGKRLYINYMRLKFSLLRFNKQNHFMKINAELCEYNKKPCILLSQLTNEYYREVLLITETQQMKISRIDLCEPPEDKSTIIQTGEIPM